MPATARARRPSRLCRLEDVALDARSIPQAALDIATKERSNPLAWSGQFSPQLVQVLLQAWGTQGGLVVDPFLGSGTLLAEAARLELPCFGTEINPAACALASIYELARLPAAARAACVAEVEEMLAAIAPSSIAGGLPEGSLLAARARPRAPDARRLLDALIVLLDLRRRAIDGEVLARTWARLRKVAAGLPTTRAPIGLAMADARRSPCADGSAALVLTSPPYINVFNYHQQYRGSVEALGWDALAVARSEIGANRKHRGNRFLTVVQYCLDLADVLRDVRRILAPRGRAIVVIGRVSQVRGTPFHNGAILASLATGCAGLALAGRQERVFTNRFGERIVEDLLHLAPTAMTRALDPRDLARDVLLDALDRAPAAARADLAAALDQADRVTPSPLLAVPTGTS